MAGKFFQVSKLLQSKFVIMSVMALILVWFTAAFALDQRSIFLPGETSDGHVLFEVSCNSCHEGFKPVSNESCNRCHEAELANDFHNAKKFRDLRWAEYLAKLDIITCTACHEEHLHMFGRGVHLQPDLCMACHEGVITGELASHNGFTADGCWTAGCHNFHDHSSISIGFLQQNLDQPEMLPKPALPALEVTVTQESAPDPDLGKEFLEVSK